MAEMICVHCGRSIPYGAERCPLCGEDTEYSLRFTRIPAPVPLSETLSSPAEEAAEAPDPSPKSKNNVIKRVLAHLHNNRKRGRKINGE